MDPSAVL